MDAWPDSQPDRLIARQVVAADRLLVIAHRGASTIAPENTLPAFQAALSLGDSSDATPHPRPSVDMVEFDYQESADHAAVVFHDDQLDRTTDACQQWQKTQIPLAEKPLTELRRLDAGRWFSERFAGTRIPTLSEALDLITARSIALVERKSGSAARCVEALRSCGEIDHVVLQAFDPNFLAECRRLASELVIAALGEHELTAAHLDAACGLSIAVIAWNNEHVTPDLIARIHARGMKCWTWTVDDPDRMHRLASWGVDGIITNRPDLLLEICRGRAS
jgi:glycerophosphoryl diester phosphodiesterase